MGSLCREALCSQRPSLPSLGLRLPCSRVGNPSSATLLNLGPRFSNAMRLHMRQRFPVILASTSNPSGGDSFQDKSEGITQPDGGQGPPIATILAGFLVFSLICWVFSSIIMWLFSFIV